MQKRNWPPLPVTASGGTYRNVPYQATATVAGVVRGVDATPAPSLEGVSPTFTYYSGHRPSGAGLATPPSALGTYTVVASSAGSVDYLPASSHPVTFAIIVSQPAATRVAIAASPPSLAVGSAVTFTATVAPIVAAQATPAGDRCVLRRDDPHQPWLG